MATMDEGTSVCSDSHRCENYSTCIEYPNNEGLVSDLRRKLPNLSVSTRHVRYKHVLGCRDQNGAMPNVSVPVFTQNFSTSYPFIYSWFSSNFLNPSTVLLRLRCGHIARRRRGSPKGARPLRWPVLRIQGHVQLQAGRLLRQWRSLRRPAGQGGGIRGVRLRRYQLRGYALRIRQGIHAARVGHRKVW